jgi:hypothetical protein
MGTTGTGMRPDGTFTLKLTPGEYEIEGHAPLASGARVGGVAGVSAGVVGGFLSPMQGQGQEQFGSVRIAVSGDMSGLTIQLGTGGSVSGKFVFEGSAPPPQLPPNQNAPVMFTGRDGSTCRSGRGQLKPDWTFTIDSVFGTCVPQMMGGFGQWSLQAFTYGDKDVTDVPITFASGQRLKDFTVVLTDKRTDLNLHVVDEQSAPTREYVVLAFTVDKSKWIESSAGMMGGGRYIRTYVPPPDRPVADSLPRPGMTAAPPAMKQSIGGLPAGDYFVVAIDDIETEAQRDPDTLEQLARSATRVTLAAGEPVDVSLRRVKLAR